MFYIGDRVEVLSATLGIMTRGTILTYNGHVYVIRRDDTGESFVANTTVHSLRLLADR